MQLKLAKGVLCSYSMYGIQNKMKEDVSVLSKKFLFRGFFTQLCAGYIGFGLVGLAGLVEYSLSPSQLVLLVMNLVGGAYVIYMLQKNNPSKLSTLILMLVSIILLTVGGIAGIAFFWYGNSLRYITPSFILLIITFLVIAITGMITLLCLLFGNSSNTD